MAETEKTLDIFSAGEKEQAEAIARLLSGVTPPEFIKHRDGRGGRQVPYVEGSYMTRQMSLITAFRWSHEVTEEKARPNWDNPIEVGVVVRVEYWDAKGNKYYHTARGQKDVAKYESDLFKMDKGKIATDNQQKPIYVHHRGDIISLFDDLKAAETDGIKKALSYFGIASDVYGKKEGEEHITEGVRDNKELIRKIREAGIPMKEVYDKFGVQSIAEVEGTIEEVLAKLKGGETDSLTLTETTEQ